MNKVNIYQVEEGFVLAMDDIWCPGSYESYETAKLAAELIDAGELDRIVERWEKIRPRNMTYFDLMLATQK